ncbi:MAG: D-aminoacylase [Elusimicrobia bacterium]|nr:D-aminoacylase [Elusimicrobiota bacterium]
MFDILIKNGNIVDGTGKQQFKADIAIENGKIVDIGNFGNVPAKKVIDAIGLTVSPGFIDMHSHADFSLPGHPSADNLIQQGVTTVVVGNCGMSPAPVNLNTIDQLKRYVAPLQSGYEFPWNWKNIKEYLALIKKKGTAVNVVSLVGHGTIRVAVMGFEDRKPNVNESTKIKKLINESMEQGVFGISFGLVYPPGIYTKTQELLESCKEVVKYGGLCTVHLRNEGNKLIEAVNEMIDVSKKTKIPIQISHHKAAGRENWGKVEKTIEMIERARKNGLDITLDQYPYTAGYTFLSALLPGWVHSKGVKELIKKLKRKEIRSRIKKEMLLMLSDNQSDTENLFHSADGLWESILISYCKKNKKYEGKTIDVISKEEDKDCFDVLFDILVKEEAVVTMVMFSMIEGDIQTVLRYPETIIGSDSAGIKGKTHPRSYGTFVRILGRYVREIKLLTLEDAVRKMTFLPARRMGLKDRGVIKKDNYADLVIFDAEKVSDTATYTNPCSFPVGIKYVLVNGSIVLDNGKQNKGLFGEVLFK